MPKSSMLGLIRLILVENIYPKSSGKKVLNVLNVAVISFKSVLITVALVTNVVIRNPLQQILFFTR